MSPEGQIDRLRQLVAVARDDDTSAGAVRALFAAYDQALQERQVAVAAVERVRALHLHSKADGRHWCGHDGFNWPCRTVRDLGGDQPEGGAS